METSLTVLNTNLQQGTVGSASKHIVLMLLEFVLYQLTMWNVLQAHWLQDTTSNVVNANQLTKYVDKQIVMEHVNTAYHLITILIKEYVNQLVSCNPKTKT